MVNYSKPYRVFVGQAYCDFATLWEAKEWGNRTKSEYVIENTITKEIIK